MVAKENVKAKSKTERNPKGKAGKRLPALIDPGDVRSGAIDYGEGRVSFGLWAPWKQGVALVGDFNGWDMKANPMEVREDGMWYTSLKLEPGEYGYQFVIDADGEHPDYISDPYARRLRWVAESPQPHAIVEVGVESYQWGDEGFGARPFHEQVIYELHVGDFSPEGTFKGVTERLDYIRDLGVGAIELMPINDFPGDQSWGYNPAYFFAPESAYGTPNDLKELIDQAHRRGIAVILDIVLNHTDASNPLTRLYAYQDNPYFGTDGNPWGFPDFNHWDEAVKRLIRDIQDYWLLEFHMDGFRYDHAEGIGFDHMSGMQFIAWAARQTKPHVYLIAEQLADPISVVQQTEINASWHESFHGMLRAQLREGDYQGRRYGDMQGVLNEMIHSRHGYSDNAQAVNYLETHDQERLAYEVRTNPNLDNDDAVLAKCKLGALALFTAASVPMLYAGQEFAMSTPKTIDANKLQWERLGDGRWNDLKNFYAGMALMRAQNPAFRQNHLEPLLVDDERKLLVFKRWTDDGNLVVVGLNFAPVQQFADITFPRGGHWHEWVFNYEEEFGDRTARTIELPGSGGKVWIAG
jgi:malto-oligosyltrehalose trehalohydrolase